MSGYRLQTIHGGGSPVEPISIVIIIPDIDLIQILFFVHSGSIQSVQNSYGSALRI